MSWSSSPPSLPSGESWGNSNTVTEQANHWQARITVDSARGIGNTFYLRVSTYWTKGSYGDYWPPEVLYLVAGSDGVSIGQPSEWSTVVRYYTGSAASSTSIKTGVSQYSTYIPSSAQSVNEPVEAPKYWTVGYNGNGATGGSTASQTKVRGTALTLRSNGYTRAGYVFVEWNTAADGSGTSYAAGGSYTANAGATLYAIWKRANIPVFVRVGDQIVQVEKAYVRINDEIKEATVYVNVNDQIIELK